MLGVASSATGYIKAMEIVEGGKYAAAPRMSSFSSKGPSYAAPSILKVTNFVCEIYMIAGLIVGAAFTFLDYSNSNMTSTL